jgi:peptidoglycan hydrolase-like protein with peptidoglycan-binding domain
MLFDVISIRPGRSIDVVLPRRSVVPFVPPVEYRRVSPALVLGGSVGLGGDNRAGDVARVQRLLARLGFAPDGEAIDALGAAIRRYQRARDLVADGRIDLGGPTQRAVAADLARLADVEARRLEDDAEIDRELQRHLERLLNL